MIYMYELMALGAWMKIGICTVYITKCRLYIPSLPYKSQSRDICQQQQGPLSSDSGLVASSLVCEFDCPTPKHQQIDVSRLWARSLCLSSMWRLKIPLYVATNMLHTLILLRDPLKRKLSLQARVHTGSSCPLKEARSSSDWLFHTLMVLSDEPLNKWSLYGN